MPTPTVTIVMPAAGAGLHVGDALDAIEAQDYPNVTEVIVAAADEETANAATRPAVTIVRSPTGRTATGLNLAIAASHGEVIVRVDAHALIPPNYVSRAVRVLEETGAANVGGMQVPIGNRFWDRAIAAAMSSPAGSGDARYRIGGRAGPVDTVYLGTFRRDTLVALGGFDETFVRHQDFELNERIRRSGGVVWFDPSLRVSYTPRDSLRSLANQYFEYGRWKRAFARTHPRSLRPRQLAPPTLVVAMLVAVLLSLAWPVFRWVPLTYVGTLCLAAIASTPKVGVAALGVPLALATMHFAWGLGFLLGQTNDR